MKNFHTPGCVQLLLFGTAALAACGGDNGTSADAGADSVVDVVSDVDDASDAADAADAIDSGTMDVPPDSDDLSDIDTQEVDGAEDTEQTDVIAVPTTCTPGIAGDATTTVLGSWSVTVVEGTGAWSVSNAAGDEVLSGPGLCRPDGSAGVAVGRGEPVVESAFGSFRINAEASRTGMTWLPTTSTTTVLTTTDTVSIEGDFFEADRHALTFSVTAQDELRIALTALSGSVEPTAGYVHFDCQPDEAFFGLGAQTVSMDLRGRTYPLWTQEQGIGKPENGAGWPLTNAPEASYAPMGVWHSSTGYSALVGHDGYHALSLCAEDGAESRLLSFPASPIIYLMPGDTPADRLAALTLRTGRASNPPDWVFAPWNDAVSGEARVRSLRDHLVESNIPSSAIWAEDWIGGFSTATGFRLSYDWLWSQEQYPELPTLIDELHDDGFAFLGYFNTFTPKNLEIYRIGAENGWLVRDPSRPDQPYPLTDAAFRDTGIVDLSTDGGRDFFAEYMLTAADDLGIDGWMADFTEWMPADAVLNSGESGWEYHNRWPLDFQRLCRTVMEQVHAASEGEPDNNWTFFVRSGWASYNGGTGGIAPVLWGGDQNTTWAYDDGLPSVVPIATHAGLSGVPLFGSDIAGYSSFTNTPTTTKELFFRWVALGAFHPVMRTHHGSTKCENWALDFDAESTEHFRRYAVIHTRLFPYLRSAMDDAIESGLPLTRHPWLQESENEAFWRDETYRFFLGADILVQPVVDAATADDGSVETTLVLPGPGWWPLLGDEPVPDALGDDGVVRVNRTIDVTEIPAHVRPGTALILGAANLMTLYGSGTERRPGPEQLGHALTVALYPSPDAGTIHESTASGLSVSGTVEDSGLWPQGVRVGGVPLAACVGEDDSPCLDLVAGEVRWSGGSGDTLTLQSGVDAALTLELEEARSVRIAWAGRAFDSTLRTSGPVDLQAAGTSWCDADE